jgi:type II secretory pathway pseudopilin PulG
MSHSEFRIQNSEFRRRRRGNSIVEVLFAILIATIGLMGAVAVFPVASATARRGRVNDALAAAARNAIHTIDSRGLRRPDMLVGWSANWDTATVGWRQVSTIGYPYGTSFCIDPRLVAANTSNAALANNFPYGNHATASNPILQMFRVSVASGLLTAPTATPPSVPIPVTSLQANSIFTLEDDVSILRSTDRSQPATQVFDFFPLASGAPSITASRRLSDGHLSWMATLTPKLDGRDYPAKQYSEEYVLSVVIFYDRPADLYTVDAYHERTIPIAFQGDGSTGGEVLLHWVPPSGLGTAPNTATDEEAKRVLKLRANDWILVAANLVMPGIATVPRFQWYRVTHCDHEPTYNTTTYAHFNNTKGYEVYATLMGQDWDTTLPNPQVTTSGVIGAAQATIVEGVVGVFEKTVRLDYGVAP